MNWYILDFNLTNKHLIQFMLYSLQRTCTHLVKKNEWWTEAPSRQPLHVAWFMHTLRTPITRSCRTITCMHLMSSHAIAMHAETTGSRLRHDDTWHYDVLSESTTTVYFSNPSNHWRSINLEISCSWPCCLLRFIIRILCTFFMHAYVSASVVYENEEIRSISRSTGLDPLKLLIGVEFMYVYL